MAAEIVHDHEIAGQDRGEQHLLDMGSEAFAVDRSIEKPRRVNMVVAQGGDEGYGFPAAIGNFGDEPFARGAHPRIASMSVLVHVSSMKTSRDGSIPPCRALQCRRRRAMSGRSRSLATAVLLNLRFSA